MTKAQAELESINARMQESQNEYHSGSGVYGTIAWLQAHQTGRNDDDLEKDSELLKNYTALGAKKPIVEEDLHEVLGQCQHETKKGGYTPHFSKEQLQAQLKELQHIEVKMAEAQDEQRSGGGVLNTMAWLKSQQRPDDKNNYDSYIHSMLQFLHGASADDVLEYDLMDKKLPISWGLNALKVTWQQLGFELLNGPIHVEMMNMRRIVQSGELVKQKDCPTSFASLYKWLVAFDEQVAMNIRLKNTFLEECCMVAHGVQFQLYTIYDQYRVLMAKCLSCFASNCSPQLIGSSVLNVLGELEACLKDEEVAIAEVFAENLDEVRMFAVISSFYEHIQPDDRNGVFLAKIMGWMSTSMSVKERYGFLSLFSHKVKSVLGGLWMRQYMEYLHLLRCFHVDYASDAKYSRSKAQIKNNPTV